MQKHEPLAEAKLDRALHGLDKVPSRSPDRAQRARADFLDRAHLLATALGDTRSPAPSSDSSKQRKGIRPMIPAIASLLLALGLVLGGGGAAFAAQDALPNEPLYPVKLLAEDAQVTITTEADARAALLLQYADRRIAELGMLGQAAPDQIEPVVARFEEQLNSALRLAAEASDSELALRILARIQAQLEVQSRVVAGIEFAAGDPLRIRERLQTAVQQRLELCRLGTENPGSLREQIRERDQAQDQLRQHERTQMPTDAGPQPGATPGPNATSGSSNGPGSDGQGGTGSGGGASGSSSAWGPGGPSYGAGPLTPTPSATHIKKRFGN